VDDKKPKTFELFELFDHRIAILAAFEAGDDSIVIEGRKLYLSMTTVSNVDYVIASVGPGLAPCANFIRSQPEFDREMERRRSEPKEPKKR